MGEIRPTSDLDRENGPAQCRWHLVWVGPVFAEVQRTKEDLITSFSLRQALQVRLFSRTALDQLIELSGL